MAGGTGIAAAGGEQVGCLRRDPDADPVIDALSQMAPLGQIRAPGSNVCRRVAV